MINADYARNLSKRGHRWLTEGERASLEFQIRTAAQRGQIRVEVKVLECAASNAIDSLTAAGYVVEAGKLMNDGQDRFRGLTINW